MEGKITTSDLVKEVADELGMSRLDVKAVVDTFFQYAGEYLQEGNEVAISKVAIFKFAYTAPKKKGTMVMNPALGQMVPLATARPEKLSIRARVLPSFAKAYAPSLASKGGKEVAAKFKASIAARSAAAKAA
jgi:nucleoid DNA-binding protein